MIKIAFLRENCLQRLVKGGASMSADTHGITICINDSA